MNDELIAELRHASRYENDPGLDAMRGVLAAAADRIEALGAELARHRMLVNENASTANSWMDKAERWEALADELAEALRAVKSDRPTAHMDRVWLQMLEVLAAHELAKEQP